MAAPAVVKVVALLVHWVAVVVLVHWVAVVVLVHWEAVVQLECLARVLMAEWA